MHLSSVEPRQRDRYSASMDLCHVVLSNQNMSILIACKRDKCLRITAIILRCVRIQLELMGFYTVD